MHEAHQSHFLLLAANVTDTQRVALNSMIATVDHEWWSFTTDAWLLCSKKGRPFYTAKLADIFKGGHGAFYLLLEIGPSDVVAGALPENAWTWLRRHHILT